MQQRTSDKRLEVAGKLCLVFETEWLEAHVETIRTFMSDLENEGGIYAKDT